ncbi:unnamed protein product, partial [Fusarium langsethiae]
MLGLRIDSAKDEDRTSLVIQELEFLSIVNFTVDNLFEVDCVTERHAIMEDVGFNLDLTKARIFKFPHENGINPNAGTPSSCPSVAKWPSLSTPVGKYIMQSAGGEEPASVANNMAI